MPRCKPGDLAVVVYSANTEWIGVLVTVIARHDLWTKCTGKLVWEVQPHCSGGKQIYRRGLALVIWDGGYVLCADDHLRPIRPGELDEDVTRDEVIKA